MLLQVYIPETFPEPEHKIEYVYLIEPKIAYHDAETTAVLGGASAGAFCPYLCACACQPP